MRGTCSAMQDNDGLGVMAYLPVSQPRPVANEAILAITTESTTQQRYCD